MVAGWSDAVAGSFAFGHAITWTSGAGLTDLGTLGGATSTAFDINDLGKVVGISPTASGDFHAFAWTFAMGISDLGTFPGGQTSRASGVNFFGRVVGQARTASGDNRAFEQLGGKRLRARPQQLRAGCGGQRDRVGRVTRDAMDVSAAVTGSYARAPRG